MSKAFKKVKKTLKKIALPAAVTAGVLLSGGTLGLAAAAGSAAASLAAKKPKAAGAVPETPPVAAEMPTNLPSDETIKLAKRKSVARQRARGGRASTILSDASESLGGG